jgi:hypothetical protein
MHGGLQNGADFSVGAAVVPRRAELQRAVDLIGKVAYGDGGHDGKLQKIISMMAKL